MNFYEEHPFWVRRDNPGYIVRVRSYDTTTSMWNPKSAWTVTGQWLNAPKFTMVTFEEPEFRKRFEEFIPPKPRVKLSSEASWWRDRKVPAIFVFVLEVIPWAGPNHPVRVRFSERPPQIMISNTDLDVKKSKSTILTEADFLERFEPSGPPPDRKTAWGKIWDD